MRGLSRCKRGGLNPSGRSGFTLIELIVVIVLIGVFLSLGMPSLREGIYADPLKTAARKLIGIVNNVRQLALENRREYIVTIDSNERRFWYNAEGPATEEEIEREGELSFPDTIAVSEVTTEIQNNANLDQVLIWVSDKGYVDRTRLRLVDESGETLYLDFYPFITEVGISDEADDFSR